MNGLVPHYMIVNVFQVYCFPRYSIMQIFMLNVPVLSLVGSSRENVLFYNYGFRFLSFPVFVPVLKNGSGRALIIFHSELYFDILLLCGCMQCGQLNTVISH